MFLILESRNVLFVSDIVYCEFIYFRGWQFLVDWGKLAFSWIIDFVVFQKSKFKYTASLCFVKHLNSWLPCNHEINENCYPKNSIESTVFDELYIFSIILTLKETMEWSFKCNRWTVVTYFIWKLQNFYAIWFHICITSIFCFKIILPVCYPLQINFIWFWYISKKYFICCTLN